MDERTERTDSLARDSDPRLVEDLCRYCGKAIGMALPHELVGLCKAVACQRRAKTVGLRRTRRHFRVGGRGR